MAASGVISRVREPGPPRTAGAAPPDDGPLSGDIEVEVAVVGGGYTGLSCAYRLARAGRNPETRELLARGFLYKEIADALKISVPTVNAHIRNMYEKLHVHSRSQAVAKYIGT